MNRGFTIGWMNARVLTLPFRHQASAYCITTNCIFSARDESRWPRITCGDLCGWPLEYKTRCRSVRWGQGRCVWGSIAAWCRDSWMPRLHSSSSSSSPSSSAAATCSSTSHLRVSIAPFHSVSTQLDWGKVRKSERGFYARIGLAVVHCRVKQTTLGTLFIHTCASVTNQYNLLPNFRKKRWRRAAGKLTTVGLLHKTMRHL